VHQQSSRQLQQVNTALAPHDVLDAAVIHFSRRSGVYAAFLERRSATHVALRGQGGEEIVVGAQAIANGTSVSASTYMFDQQVARFLATLPPYVAPPVLEEPVPDAVDVAPVSA
jgi:hypothetical protein